MSAPDQRDWGSLSSAEILRYATQEVAARQSERQDRLKTYGDGSLWMAMVPFTTVPLASLAGVENVEPLVKELEGQGLVEGTVPAYLKARGDEQTVYSMTAAGRTAILGKYIGEWWDGQHARATVANFCRPLTAPNAASRVPAPVLRWAELAAYASDGERLVKEFDDRVQGAFDDRDAGALLNWIEAAQSLDELLQRDADQSLSEAIKRASRRVELLARRAADERHLKDFLERQEQVDAFRELVNGPDDLWALHLFGVGGVGKTMALRHLTGELAPNERELNAYTARIDFDYLNPDYPRLDPGLLLWSFAEELRPYDTTGRATELFAKSDERLAVLRQKLVGERGSQTGKSTADPRFIDATIAFIDALRALDRRVILIVDTCEELSKIRPDGRVPENVEETFRILEALHDGPDVLRQHDGAAVTAGRGVPSLRVVFAGRRPLARSGHGWTCETSPSTEHKKYLRLHELRGFTEDDSRRFLRERVKVPETYVDTIVKKSPDVGSPALIAWVDPDDIPANVPRCNPYDLKFYADWALEDPPPTPETIANATNAQYVQVRILRRLEKYAPLRQVMPIVALVKYVDEELLGALFPDDEATAKRVFERLRQQEWTDQRSHGSRDGTKTRAVLTVEEGLRRRLATYFEARERPHPEQLAHAFDYFENVTKTRDLGQLDWPVFDAALRLMDLDPGRGVRWWKGVERRILRDRERGAAWLQDLTGTLIAEKNAAEKIDATLAAQGAREHSLRPLVVASFASALWLTDQQTAALETSWEEVDAKTASFVVAEERPLLQHRAKCGLFVAAARLGGALERVLPAAEAVFAAPPLDPADAEDAVAIAAATMSAGEALVELFEVINAQERPSLVRWLDAPSGPIPFAQRMSTNRSTWARAMEEDARSVNSLAAFACVTAARAHAFRDEYDAADRLFSEALASDDADNAPGFIDWAPPRYLDARIKLELARTLCPALLTPADTLRRTLNDAVAYVPDPDIDRLLSLTTSLAASIGPGHRETLRSFKTSVLAEGMASAATCQAHRAIRPFYVTIERELAWQGYVDEAVSALRSAPTGPAVNVAAILNLERAIAEIILRMRLREAGERPSGPLSDSPWPDDRLQLWAIAACSGEENVHAIPAQASRRPDWVHAAWQSIAAVGADEIRTAVQWADDTIPAIETLGDDFFGLSLSLDLAEAAMLFSQQPMSVGGVRTRPVNALEFSQRHPVNAFEAFRILLRAEALSHNETNERALAELSRRIGPRYAARLTLAEGDLLMLRLPAPARNMFSIAASLFKDSRDVVGEFLSRARVALCSPREEWPRQWPQVVEAYAAMCSAQPDLALPSITTPRDFAAAAETAPPGWRPWLQRALLVGGREATPDGSMPATTYWTPGSAQRLAPEVRRIVSVEPAAAPAQAPAAAQPSRLIEAGKNIFFFLLGLAMIFTFFALSYRAFRWVTDPVLPSETSTSVRVVGYGLTLVSLGFGIPWLRRRVLRALASRSTATIVIDTVETAAQEYLSRALETEVELVVSVQRARLRWIPPGITLHEDSPFEDAKARSGGLAPYKDSSASFKDAVRKLVPLAQSLGSGTMAVRFQCPPDLEEPCWEGLLQLALVDDAARVPVLRCRRIPRQLSRTRYIDAGNGSLAVFAFDAASKTVVRRAWERLKDQGSLAINELEPETYREDRDGNERIVHLLGRIVEGHNTVAFEMTRGESRRRAKAGSSQNLAAEDVAYMFPRATLVVVQPPLLPRIGPRDTSDRDDAMLARKFGAELFHLGVPAVLVLPRLDAMLATTAATAVARAVARQRLDGTAELEAAVVDVQHQLRRGLTEAKTPADAINEIVLDTCLFCVDDWDGRLHRGRLSASESRAV